MTDTKPTIEEQIAFLGQEPLAEELLPPIDFGCSHKYEEYIDYACNPPRRWSVDLKGKSCAECKRAREKGQMK